jgi:hypothetical protein
MSGMGNIGPIRAPSGQMVSLSKEDEAEIVKGALADKIRDSMMMSTDIRKSAISAVGNAIGFAVGGLLVGLLIGQKG